jgi:hypothetical protein
VASKSLALAIALAPALIFACTDLGGLSGVDDAGVDAAAEASGVDAPGTDAGDAGTLTFCDSAKPFGLPTRLATLSSPLDENGIALTIDQRYAIVGRSNNDAGTLYSSTRTTLDDSFTAPTAIGIALAIDGAPSLGDDGLVLVFQSTPTLFGTIRLYITTRPSLTGTFVPPTELTSISGTLGGGSEADPSLTPTALYYTSFQLGGTGYDLARADRAGTAVTAPALIAELASKMNDVSPAVRSDELEIYFSSMRSTTDYDIYTAVRASKDAPWTDVHAVAELNAVGVDDAPRWISPDGCTIYLTSSRAGSVGGSDLWVAHR